MDKSLPAPNQQSIPTKSEFVEPRLTELGNLRDLTMGDVPPGFSEVP